MNSCISFISTIPFIFEGEKKIIQALDGVERIAQHVDALLVINNERLRAKSRFTVPRMVIISAILFAAMESVSSALPKAFMKVRPALRRRWIF